MVTVGRSSSFVASAQHPSLQSSSAKPRHAPSPSDRLRILHVVQGYSPAVGGSERVMQRLSEELVAGWGDQLTIFTTDCRNAEAFPRPSLPHLRHGWETSGGVDIRRFRVLRNFGPLLAPVQDAAFRLGLPFNDHLRTWYAGPIIPGLARSIRRQPADVVAATSFPLRHMYQALRGAHGGGRPCVLIGGLHPDDRWGYDRPMIHRAIRRADLYVAYTQLEARHVIEHGAPADRVEVIGVGVDPDQFASADAGPASSASATRRSSASSASSASTRASSISSPRCRSCGAAAPRHGSSLPVRVRCSRATSNGCSSRSRPSRATRSCCASTSARRTSGT
jgi:glycosyltransferase involved in cell wall biosynthesis